MSDLRILVTNDDGIGSPGLAALARCAAGLGYETVIAAPDGEASGTGTGLMAAERDRRVVLERRELPGLDVEAYAVAAHPGLIALLAAHEAFGARPDVVLSGVNRGPNVGRAILHSGTVGAALTGAINGARALAVSLDVPLDEPGEPHWETATGIVAKLLPGLAERDEGSVFNLNVPDAPRVRGLRWARLATFGRVQNRLTRLDDGTVELAAVVVDGELEPGTDAALLADGHATLTPLRSVGEDPALMSGEPV